MHFKRQSALLDAVEALLIGKRLSLTYLGRNLQSKTKEKNCIRKIDRLLGNKKLHSEIGFCYESHCKIILSKISRPLISVDWAATDKRKDWHILRASVNIKGRGFVLYQEVHPHKKLNSRQVQHRFLEKIKIMLPENCTPIIVADAGFRFPWFSKIKELGFDFVGRVRNKTSYKKLNKDSWYSNCLDLYKKATSVPKHLGKMFFAKKIDLECEVVIYKKPTKHRKNINRSGRPTDNTVSHRCARSERDPWLLVTSLDVSAIGAQKIISFYAKRMQIEEDFRDLKSHKFGFGLRYAMSKSQNRIAVLLLIAALASLICWLISLDAKENKIHLDFQSNTIKHRDVLSVIYLACQLIRKGYLFNLKRLKDAFLIFLNQAMEAVSC